MKRSEMRYQIAETLIEDCGLDFLAMKPIDVAEEILKAIEAAGMLPPPLIFESSTHNRKSTMFVWEQET